MKIRLTILLLMGLCCAGCHRNNRAATPPVPRPIPTPFDEAEKLFAAGKYRESVAAYETYLMEYPRASNSDLALLRLAIAHALPDSSVRDPHRASAELERLITVYPESPWRRHAQYLLELEATARRTALELSQLAADFGRARALPQAAQPSEGSGRAEVDRMRAEVRDRDERIRRLQSEVEGLQERVRRLGAEIDLLKRIDLQRRPSRPPPE